MTGKGEREKVRRVLGERERERKKRGVREQKRERKKKVVTVARAPYCSKREQTWRKTFSRGGEKDNGEETTTCVLCVFVCCDVAFNLS